MPTPLNFYEPFLGGRSAWRSHCGVRGATLHNVDMASLSPFFRSSGYSEHVGPASPLRRGITGEVS